MWDEKILLQVAKYCVSRCQQKQKIKFGSPVLSFNTKTIRGLSLTPVPAGQIKIMHIGQPTHTVLMLRNFRSIFGNTNILENRVQILTAIRTLLFHFFNTIINLHGLSQTDLRTDSKVSNFSTFLYCKFRTLIAIWRPYSILFYRNLSILNTVYQ